MAMGVMWSWCIILIVWNRVLSFIMVSFCIAGPLWGESLLVTGGFPPQKASTVAFWQSISLNKLFNSLRSGDDICVGNLTIIGADNGLSPGWRQAIILTNAGIMLIWTLGTNFCEILIEIHTFSFKKIHLKVLSAKWQNFVSALIC